MKREIVLGVSMASLGAVSALIWFYSKTKSKKRSRVEIQIPNSAVGYVIGRSGISLKCIETKSKARIRFLPPEGSSCYSTCIIKGDLHSVQLAADIINDLVNNFEYENDTYSDCPEKFQFQALDEKFFDDISYVVGEVLGGRSNHSGNDRNEAANYEIENVNDFISRHVQKLYSPGGDGLIPVYVSAIYTPEKFWIQLIKTKEHAELDRLTEKMLNFYSSDPSLNVPPVFDDIKNGYLCAVFFEEDKRWYRAQVCSISKYDQNTLPSEVDLFLLDFGESIYEKVANLRPIPSEYLNLNFQAIECGLSNIKANSETWTDEAIQYFENIVHVGQWYTLMARIDFHEEGYRPYLTLIDNNGEMSINIAENMEKNGFGKTLD